MDARNYTSIGPVLHLNKAGELAQKRMKAAKLCDGLYITEPDKSGYTQFICELNGVVWIDCKAAENRIADGIKLMPGYFDKIKAGCFDGENFPEFKREISRRINHPDSPAIMELKKPERKKSAPLPEGVKKVGVIMFKGCTDEIIDKKVIINEVAPHVYTHTYKLKGYGERVKIIFEIDGVYFQGADNGAFVMERENFTEICAKAYEHARENVADGAAKGMVYFIEVQKRIDAATSPEVAQTADTGAGMQLPNEDINYMFYIKPKGEKRFSTYNPGKGTMNTGRVFTELYRKEHLSAVCKWIAEDKSGDFAYQLRSGDGKRIFWEHNPTAATPSETPQISTRTARIENVPTETQKPVGTKIDEETRQYIISTYKTKENLTAKFSDAIGSIAMELEEYRANKRKGGRMRKENIRRLEEQIKLLYAQLNEWSALFDTSQSSESWQVVNYPTYAAKPRETARKEPKRTIPNMGTVAPNINAFFQAGRYGVIVSRSVSRSKVNIFHALCSTAYSPPIRGDCNMRLRARAKPPNRLPNTAKQTFTDHLNITDMNFISKLFNRKSQPTKEAATQPVEIPDKLTDTAQPTTLKEAFSQKYPAYMNILNMFEAANLCDATWENLTKVRLQRFIDYMGERLSPNSVNQYAAKLKSVLNLYADEVLLPRGYAKVLTPKKVTSTAVFLSESELQKLIDYTPKNDRERYVRNMFVTCAFCGMRHSDAIRLNESNINGDSLQYVSVKTKIQAIVPLKPIVREYILNRTDVSIDDTTYNRIIRNICKKCGITDKVKVFKAGKECEGEKWEYVSSHTARRSCASNLYLKGLDLYTISRFLGHSSADMTAKYICCGIRELPQEAKEYFSGF